ncbi:hypothetical protein Moror_1529 [Moniliophthora roreri MCA 2997]|uniref:F-box domain-containing protein n=2 Tax=Moniliophthora roreri TaxID=221103 RepID=V2XLD1_MONRO|nr:hypothetical protein Moror_1529 [Moniliophthora roreri MCA 2997]KAI3609611.1 hypothetical protein WG66_001185 [Moniliophthora roreri]
MNLPKDIWVHIASYVSPLQLEDLYSVNSAFFNIAMDQRYQQISFTYLTRKMVRTLERLKDPAVTKRVRIIYIHPHFVKEVINKEQQISNCSNSSLLSRLGDLAYHVRDQRLFGKPRSRSPLFKFKTFDSLMHVMVDILGGLPNLEDVHISWSGLPFVGESPIPIISAALVPHLRRLWLDVSLEKLEPMLPHFARLADVEELDLFIRIEHLLDSNRYNVILIKFAQCINYLLRRTLRKLSIQLFEPLDMSPFFSSLGRLPLLESLSLSIPVSSPHLGDPDGLIDFLNLHTLSLRSLSIRATELSGRGFTPIDTDLCEWMNTTFPSIRLLRLSSLEISLNLIPLETALVCVRKFASSLTSLTLTGRHLSFHEVQMVTDAFPEYRHGLESLRIGSVTLTPQVLDVLAERLPLLSRLELLVREVLPCEGDFPLYYRYGDRSQDESQVTRFFEEMETRFYPDWRVRHLVLSLSSFPFKLQHDTMYKDLFRHCAPSIQTFA